MLSDCDGALTQSGAHVAVDEDRDELRHLGARHLAVDLNDEVANHRVWNGPMELIRQALRDLVHLIGEGE
jgi:hypothetical protein